MDELLAQELGIGGTSYVDAEGNLPPAVPQEQPAPEMNMGGYTEEDLMGLFGAPVALPSTEMESPAPAPQPGIVDPFGPGDSVAMKESGKGFSPEKHAQLSSAKGPEGDLRRNQAAIAENAGNQYEAVSGLFSNAQDLESQAIDNETSAQIEYDTEVASQKGVLAAHQRETGTKSAEIQAKWSGAIAQSRADYVAALNDFRASKVNPAQLWDNMSTGERIGTMAAAFVHGFLGAKGIKTDVMDTLNRAIDRNINAQLEQIKKKGQVAEGFRNLWDMQRAESSSEAEAYTRMRGFMLEAATLEVEQHMGQFKTGVTQAKGEAAKAKLEAERAKNMFEVFKYVDQSKNAQMQQELSWQVAKMQNAQQGYANSIAARRLKLDEAKAAREKAQEAKARVLINPETGRAERVFRDDVDKSQVAEVRNRMAGLEASNAQVARIRELSRKVSAKADGLPTRFTDEDARELEGLRYAWAQETLGALGQKATKEDVEQFLLSVPRDTWLTTGGVDKILANTQARIIDNVNAYVKQYTVDIGQVDPLSAGKNMPLSATRKEAGLVGSGEADKKDLSQKINETAAKQVNGPASLEPVTDVGSSTKKDAEQFAKQYPQQAMVAVKEVEKANKGAYGIPAAQVGMSTLATQAAGGSVQARKQLEFYADTYRRGVPGSDSDWRGAYASMLLDRIDGNTVPGPDEQFPPAPPVKSDYDLYMEAEHDPRTSKAIDRRPRR